jgi:hypothetical protein
LDGGYFIWAGRYRELLLTAITVADFRIPLRFSAIQPGNVKCGKIAGRSAAFDKL